MEMSSIVVYVNGINELDKFLKENKLSPLDDYDKGYFNSIGYVFRHSKNYLLFFINKPYVKKLKEKNMSPKKIFEFINSSYTFTLEKLSDYLKRIRFLKR